MVRLLGFAILVLAVVAAFGIGTALPHLLDDLAAYLGAGERLAAGRPLYPGPGQALGLFAEYRYPPHVAVLFVPLAALPVGFASALWLGLQIAVAIAIGIALVRALPGDVRPWAAAGYAVYLPLILEIGLGNVNLLTLGLCLLAWRWRERPPVGGALLAAAVSVKLLPLTLGLFYLAAGRVRLVLWSIAAGLSLLALVAVAMPARLAEYLRFLPRLADDSWVRPAIDRESPAALVPLFWDSPLGALLAALACATAVLAGLQARRRPVDAPHLHTIALATAPYLAPFAVFWIPFLVFALPLFASTLARALALRPSTTRIAAVAALMACWLLVQLHEVHDLVPMAAHLAGVAGLCALAIVLLRAGRPSAVPAA